VIPFEKVTWSTRFREQMTGLSGLLGSVKTIWAPIGVLYAMTVFFAVGRFNPSTVQAIIQRQGLATVALGVAAGSVKAFASVAFIVGAIGVVAGYAIRRLALLVFAVAVMLLAFALMPWTVAALAVVIVLLIVWTAGRRTSSSTWFLPLLVALVLLGWILVSPIVQAFTTPWLPLERLETRTPPTTSASTPTAAPPTAGTGAHRGYVLGEQSGMLALLVEENRKVVWIDAGLERRQICDPTNRWYTLDGKSLLEELLSPDYECRQDADSSPAPSTSNVPTDTGPAGTPTAPDSSAPSSVTPTATTTETSEPNGVPPSATNAPNTNSTSPPSSNTAPTTTAPRTTAPTTTAPRTTAPTTTAPTTGSPQPPDTGALTTTTCARPCTL
jgi:hypothetical protein